MPISLVWDNARYQKCAAVFELATELGITLVYLPAYSPHLNLIERLWKFVRKECLYSKYYADFPSFRAAISTLIEAGVSRGWGSIIVWGTVDLEQSEQRKKDRR